MRNQLERAVWAVYDLLPPAWGRGRRMLAAGFVLGMVISFRSWSCASCWAARRPRVRKRADRVYRASGRSARKKHDEGYRKTAADRDRRMGDGKISWRCPDCGKTAFATRDAARRFARRVYPGRELSPYPGCDGASFHLTSQDAGERERWKNWAAGA